MIYEAFVVILEDLRKKPREIVITDERGDVCGEMTYKDGKFIVEYAIGKVREYTEVKTAATELARYTRIR
ncbi:hypothetical protein P4S95_08290 [Aneurinibacillus aneurinilyticus]|uniref:hypothetical protein n=1 Tax=Aneurinibacillus aneurinilyticus TaxID=1391 RepID=UPI002E1A901E|nr:hypothetical protein [Aneurinibacillus aneurinilyticus]